MLVNGILSLASSTANLTGISYLGYGAKKVVYGELKEGAKNITEGVLRLAMTTATVGAIIVVLGSLKNSYSPSSLDNISSNVEPQNDRRWHTPTVNEGGKKITLLQDERTPEFLETPWNSRFVHAYCGIRSNYYDFHDCVSEIIYGNDRNIFNNRNFFNETESLLKMHKYCNSKHNIPDDPRMSEFESRRYTRILEDCFHWLLKKDTAELYNILKNQWLPLNINY